MQKTPFVGYFHDCCTVDWYVNEGFYRTTGGVGGDSKRQQVTRSFSLESRGSTPGTLPDVPSIGSLSNAKIEMIAHWVFTGEGVPPIDGSSTKIEHLKVVPPGSYPNTLSEISKAFPEDDGRTPPDIGARVTYTVTLSTADNCSVVKWFYGAICSCRRRYCYLYSIF